MSWRSVRAWFGDGAAGSTREPFRHLVPGWRYRVAEAFVDHDGIEHPVGESWTFRGSSFLPYEDGRSLFVAMDGGAERQIRLQERKDAQEDIVSALTSHVRPVARRPDGHAMLLTRDSVCLADDVEAPHPEPLEVGRDADARDVAEAILDAGYLPCTSGATWSLSLGKDRVVFGRRWACRFYVPSERASFTARAETVDTLHLSYHAQADPAEVARHRRAPAGRSSSI